MRYIAEFCNGAERIYTSTTTLKSIINSNININKDEIKRSRWSKNYDCIFNFILNISKDITLNEQIKHMKTIEMYYPDMFSWRFDGKYIEAIAMIPMRKKNLGIFTRYRGQINFIKYLRKQIVNILKFRGTSNYNYSGIIEDLVFATGSINSNTQLFVINITPKTSIFDILKMSNDRKIDDTKIKELNMRYWVREINPDFYKANSFTDIKNKKEKATSLSFGTYPPCVKKLAALPKKGNYNRFLISTFLLGMHGERDAKQQFDMMLTDNERHHINSGNCKDQWRTIVTKGYNPPSCKTMIESGYCPGNCGRPMPTYMEEIKNGESN